MTKGVLLTYSLSRLSKSLMDTLKIAERLDKAGGSLCPLDLPAMDTTTPSGRLMLSVMASVMEYHRLNQNQVTALFQE